MINLDNYKKHNTPRISRVPRKYGAIIHYIGKSNSCEAAGEPWKYIPWTRAYTKGCNLPDELAGKVPSDVSLADAFLCSLYDQITVNKILDDARKDPHVKMALTLQDQELQQTLAAAIQTLSPRERQIITLRFGLGGGKEQTQKEVADQLGISQSYISRLEKRIIHRLKKEILRLS